MSAPVPIDYGSGEVELHAELLRLLDELADGAPLAPVGSPQWWAAADSPKAATVLLCGMATILAEPDRAQRSKSASVDLAQSQDWTQQSRRPSHATLVRRRNPHGRAA